MHKLYGDFEKKTANNNLFKISRSPEIICTVPIVNLMHAESWNTVKEF